MSDHHAFLRGIIEYPNEPERRLAYADWLREHGDDARAEFIGVQCELAALQADQRRRCVGTVTGDMESAALRRRERELLAGHAWGWAGKAIRDAYLAGTDWTQALVYGRGFVEVITATWELVRTHLPAIRQATPLRRVVLTTWPEIEYGGQSHHHRLHRFVGSERWHRTYEENAADGIPAMLAAEFGSGLEWVLPEARIDPIAPGVPEGLATAHRDLLEAAARQLGVPAEMLGG